ncbi:MAG: SOS response-associated peptidase [Pseudomonadota bacterium]
MCGRFMLKSPVDEIASFFGIDPSSALHPRYNIAPSQEAAIIRSTSGGGRRLAFATFGLVPHWAEDPKVGYKMINARAETIDSLPSFRDAYRRRRCLVPADGFFEWQIVDATGQGPKQPYSIRRVDEKPFAFAGIHERWEAKHGGRIIESFAIVTTQANRTLAAIHPRMPVVLDAERGEQWLDTSIDGCALLKPCPEDWLVATMVGTRVNKPANDDPSVLEPTDRPITPAQGSLF